MNKSEKGGLAVVTGASSGIGVAYADRLAARGHPLLLVARRAAKLKEVADTLSARHGVKVETLVADLEDAADLRKLEDRLKSDPVAILVNNAGAGGLGPSAKSTADQMERIIRLNITSLTRLSHAALEGFRARGTGVLINIASIIALAPSEAGAVYGGSKAYVLNFSRSLQLEYAKSDIKIQVVLPGPIRTEFFAAQGMDDSIFPDHTYLTPEQLVDAALSGLDAGEKITHPTLSDIETWHSLEAARKKYMAEVFVGQVAPRYL